MLPREAFAYGRALFVEEYADTVLAAAGGLGIFRPIFFAVTKGEDPDLEKARRTWREDLPPILSWLDNALDKDEYFAGGALSIADIAVVTVFMQIALVAHTPLDDFPALAAHYDRVTARPSIAEPFSQADSIVRKALPDRFDLT